MNIGMLLPGRDFPPDIRVEKEAHALRDAGHSVFILCDRSSERAPEENRQGIMILRRTRMPVPLQFEKFNRIPGWQALLDRHWQQHIAKAVRAYALDALHAHDLPKSGAAIAAGRAFGLPVVLDLHENFPGSMETYVAGMAARRRWAGRLLISTSRWSAYEKKQTQAADRIIIVVAEFAERLRDEHGITADKITVVENTEPLEQANRAPIDRAIVARYRDDFVILYLGGFGGRADHRGLTTALEALPGVLRSIPQARLLLVGKGAIRPILDKMARTLGIAERVTMMDWIPQAQVYSYIAASTVCLVPYNSTWNTEISCPNKLFQYLYMEKPVVVSSCRSLQRYIVETGGGMVFRAGDAEDMSRVIVQLKDEALRADLGRKGRASVVSKLNWGVTAKALVALYEQLAAGTP